MTDRMAESTSRNSPGVRATVDFEKSGRQTGFIQVPLSVHDGAWGVIPIPIAVISNGRGPTLILEGGNHGDEYEGPIALGELIRELDPGAVSGRLISIPAINLPAVMAACRTSPLDDLNFNRAFPGNPRLPSNLLLVSAGKPAVSDDVGHQDRRELAHLAHERHPSVNFLSVDFSKGSVLPPRAPDVQAAPALRQSPAFPTSARSLRGQAQARWLLS